MDGSFSYGIWRRGLKHEIAPNACKRASLKRGATTVAMKKIETGETLQIKTEFNEYSARWMGEVAVVRNRPGS